MLASYPAPTQLSVAYSTVLIVTESWAGPGYKARSMHHVSNNKLYCYTVSEMKIFSLYLVQVIWHLLVFSTWNILTTTLW